MSQTQSPDAGGEDCCISRGILEAIRREVTIVDMLADEITQIFQGIYVPPFRIITNFTEYNPKDTKLGKPLGDRWSVEIRSNECLSSVFSAFGCGRFGQAIISTHGIYISESPLKAQSVTKPEFPIEHPQMFELFLSRFHHLLTAKILGKAGSMESSQAICGADSYAHRIEHCYMAVVLFDIRYLAHMYSTKYLGWESIPDLIVVGSVDDNSGSPEVNRRSYSKKQVEDEMYDPSRWEGD